MIMDTVLSVTDIRVRAGEKEILKGVAVDVGRGSVTAIMGPNGSGKSTLTAAIMGNPDYAVTGAIRLEGRDISGMPAEERAKAGVFLAFQSPIGVPGVSVINLLKSALQARSADPVSAVGIMTSIRETAALLKLDESLLTRGVNDGFSGGERKKMELLQALMLKPRIAMFDEIDTGLDVDALKIVADGIRRLADTGTGVLVITHYNRILKYLRPDSVIVLAGGLVRETGDASLAAAVERDGYARYVQGRSPAQL